MKFKNIQLPSGKVLTVAYFQDPDVPDDLKMDFRKDLNVCTTCQCSMVYPVAWREEGDDWIISLRCPN